MYGLFSFYNKHVLLLKEEEKQLKLSLLILGKERKKKRKGCLLKWESRGNWKSQWTRKSPLAVGLPLTQLTKFKFITEEMWLKKCILPLGWGFSEPPGQFCALRAGWVPWVCVVCRTRQRLQGRYLWMREGGQWLTPSPSSMTVVFMDFLLHLPL